jgi:hypothetical protein
VRADQQQHDRKLDPTQHFVQPLSDRHRSRSSLYARTAARSASVVTGCNRRSASTAIPYISLVRVPFAPRRFAKIDCASATVNIEKRSAIVARLASLGYRSICQRVA